LGIDANPTESENAMPATVESTPFLPGLSPVCGKPIVARFDAAHISSDGGLLALREVEQRPGIAQRLAACIGDPRAPERIMHGLDEIIRFRMLMIAAGYEDGNDADALRGDPMFKLAMERLPEHADLCSQSTISRTENRPDARALLRIGRAMVDHYCHSFRHVPRRIVLDIDDTFDAVHGGQQLRLFNAHHDEYGFQPIVVFDAEGRMIAAVLRPACRPDGRQIVCCRASANQMRLFLHVGAYWLMWSLRALMPRRSSWRVAQFDTLRLRLIKLAVRIDVLKRQIRLHLPRATPDQAIFALVLTRMSRLIV
jgi:hypothetical protein